MTRMLLCIALLAGPVLGAAEWRRPFIADVFFYWYIYDRETELGWDAGVHFTPLYGYYDSRTFKDNRHSLWLASEWGMTHHFIDYWSPTWKDENGEMREKTVFRAAESLRTDGYDISMAYYQDGSNFAMDDFSKNVSEKRDVHQWLRDFARSPVMPRVGARRRPMQLVYGRNGVPKLTATDDGFRAWLRLRYGSIEKLNAAHGTRHKTFDEVKLDFGFGRARADSIRYQYHVWQAEWEKLDGMVRDELKMPGVAASFDIGYKPFRGWGRSEYFRVFGGPHSYGGIFAQPHDQDAHRFLCSILAKKHDTVFFDHYKHCYHDWNIRVPGTAYLHEPHHFDRFWVGCLQRANEGVLHMSWNEWWEGSNLEPSMETGKLYCEKHLFYSTLMQRCFPSIRDWGKGAPVALILNDWHLLTAEGKDDDLFAALQALRRLGARFDIIPEERVTADALKPFKLVIAPGCDSGFGDNARREDIHDTLLAWCRAGGRLWASANPRLAAAAGLKAPRAKETGERGKDFNLFIDVGTKGDEGFLLGGASHREDWGKLPAGKFGAGTSLTVRWTPASGRTTRLALPVAANRDHVLRLGGSALLAHRADVLLDNRPVGALAIKPGINDYELRIPAALVGGRQQATLAVRYEKPVIPKELDPAKFPTEGRACNLAIDWLQWATANVAKGDKRTTYKAPDIAIRLTDKLFGALAGKTVESGGLRAMPLTAPKARALSVQTPDGAARDILLPLGRGEMLYVNGRFSDLASLDYWHALLANWAKLPPARPIIASDDVMSARLDADDTTILLAYNEDIATKGQKLHLRLPVRAIPLSEALVLSHDGKTYLPLKTRAEKGHILVEDSIRYYGVYQFAFSPVRVVAPRLEVCQGEKATLRVKVENLTDKPVRGSIRVACVVPTLGGPPTDVALGPRETKEVLLTVEAAELCDWGTKTVTLEIAFGGRRACLFRPCRVLRRPDVQLAHPLIDAEKGGFTLVPKATPHAVNASVTSGRLSLRGAQSQSVNLGADSGCRVTWHPEITRGEGPELRPLEFDLTYRVHIARDPYGKYQFHRGAAKTKRFAAHLAVCPKAFDAPADAVQPIVVFNPRDVWLDHEMVHFAIEPQEDPDQLFIRATDGRPVPFYRLPRLWEGRKPPPPGAVAIARREDSFAFFAVVPPRSGRVFFLCRSRKPPVVPVPLRVRATDIGSAKARAVISNPRLEVVIDGSRGGTITRLLSKRTGREYAAASFGAIGGKLTAYDPRRPATNTVRFLRSPQVRQADERLPLWLSRWGSCRVSTHLRWGWPQGASGTEQSLHFTPWEDGFTVATSARCSKTKGTDLVFLDARFRAEHFTKTYPNFVGVVNDKEQPHFGWRRGAWVPDVLTFMRPPDFRESISLIHLEPRLSAGVARVRQGFWPEARPKPGKVTYAVAEYVADPNAYSSRLMLKVRVHRGYHLHAKRWRRRRLEQEPLVVLPTKFQWGKRFKPTEVDFPADWFSPYWHARMVVAVPEEKGRIAVATKALAKELGGRPKAFRCVQANEENDLAEREFEVSEDGQRVIVDVDPRWGRALHVYGSLEALPSPLRLRTSSTGIRLETFEKPAEGWRLGGVQVGAFGREGSRGVRLTVGEGGSPVVVSNGAVAVVPEAEYRLTFWARTGTPGASVRTNFYANGQYDFGQEQVKLTADGQWHRYEATVRAGKFPPSVGPVLRLWALGRPQVVDVDDLELATETGPPAAIEPTKVERLR